MRLHVPTNCNVCTGPLEIERESVGAWLCPAPGCRGAMHYPCGCWTRLDRDVKGGSAEHWCEAHAALDEAQTDDKVHSLERQLSEHRDALREADTKLADVYECLTVTEAAKDEVIAERDKLQARVTELLVTIGKVEATSEFALKVISLLEGKGR